MVGNKTRIIVVRHCEARGNIDRIFQGHTDAEISENGERQLLALTERFKNIHFDAIYSSPLKRARLTAEAVNAHENLPITLVDELKEINGGNWEGQLFAELPKLFPESSHAWANEPSEFAPDGGESMREVFARISGAVQKIVAQNRGKTVVIVSHGCAIRNLLCYLKGWPIEQLLKVDWCDNTGVAMADIDENGNIDLILENDISHLTHELSTLSKQNWWRKNYKGDPYDEGAEK